MNTRRTAARLLAAPAAAGVALLAVAGPASAHVTVTPTTTAAGAYTVLTVSVPHGCEGSPTTKVAIQIPEEILSVTPTRNPLWDVTKQKQKLAEPVTDAHGNEVTERDAAVVYTAKTPLPDGYRDAFELSLQLPEEEGKTLAFPAIQTCEKGETAWAEIAAESQDAEELEHPAPTVTITAAEEEDGHGDAATTAASASGEDAAASEASEDEDSNTLAAVGLGAGVLGLLAGATALFQVRRRA
jgi:uncharacterized protein YcnI